MDSGLSIAIATFKTSFTDQLGRFPQTGLVAIAIDPGPMPTQCEGIRAVFQRAPSGYIEPERVSGATYASDYFKIELINFIPFSDYSDPAKADAMNYLLRKIQLKFQTANTIYLSPSGESYERAIVQIWMPILALR